MREQVRAITYRWLTPVWPMTAVGLLVGAVAGGFAAPLLSNGSPTATVLIRIDPPIDANQIVTNSPPAAEAQQAYLAGEIVYLSSKGFAEAVGGELKLPNPPSLAAAQQGQSALVQITATEPTTDEATAVLDRALKVYAGRITQLASERTGAAIDAITTVIVQVREEAVANAKRDGEPVDQTGLDGKLAQLEQQRLSLQSQQLRAPGIQVIEPITAQPETSDPSLLIVGGGMLGGMVALAGNLVWRRRTGVIASASHVDRQVSPVLLPVVRLGKRAGTYARSELTRARTLYGQLPAPRAGEILVVGASRYSGTEVVAQLLYIGAAEHASVTAINVTDEYANLTSAAVRAKLDALSTDENQTIIIDGGSVATAPQMLAVAERAEQIVVVIRIGRDVAAEVEVLLHAIRHEDVPITAICTKGSLPALERSSAGRRGRSEGGRHSAGNRAPTIQPVTATPAANEYGLPVEESPSWTQTSWMSQPAEAPGAQTDEVHADLPNDQPDVAIASAALEAPTVQLPLQTQDEQHDDSQANDGLAAGEPAEAPVETFDEHQATDEAFDERDEHQNDALTPEAPAEAPAETFDEHQATDETYAQRDEHQNDALIAEVPEAPVAQAPLQTQDEHDDSRVNDALTVEAPEPPADHAFARAPDDQHHEHSDDAHENGQPDLPAPPTVESPTDQNRSFGTGLRQLLQFRRQPDVDGQQDATQSESQTPNSQPKWVSLLARDGDQPQQQPAREQTLDQQQSEPSEGRHEAHVNGQTHDEPPNPTQEPGTDEVHGKHEDHHGDQFQNH